ncbi:unnamed protein product [Citrullus colocynthis]|uniref:Uncharacterized protein n=1 Tax=Citrullus colocynthis TaxID=252529 RepID=A0ABP0YL91_9ROSI
MERGFRTGKEKKLLILHPISPLFNFFFPFHISLSILLLSPRPLIFAGARRSTTANQYTDENYVPASASDRVHCSFVRLLHPGGKE